MPYRLPVLIQSLWVQLTWDSKPAWPALSLVLRVKINPAVRTRLGHHVHLEVKVFERLVVTHVIQVAAVTVRHERAVLDLPSVLVFLGGLPALERFAVHERLEAGLNFRAKPGRTKKRSEGG